MVRNLGLEGNTLTICWPKHWDHNGVIIKIEPEEPKVVEWHALKSQRWLMCWVWWVSQRWATCGIGAGVWIDHILFTHAWEHDTTSSSKIAINIYIYFCTKKISSTSIKIKVVRGNMWKLLQLLTKNHISPTYKSTCQKLLHMFAKSHTSHTYNSMWNSY